MLYRFSHTSGWFSSSPVVTPTPTRGASTTQSSGQTSGYRDVECGCVGGRSLSLSRRLRGTGVNNMRVTSLRLPVGGHEGVCQSMWHVREGLSCQPISTGREVGQTWQTQTYCEGLLGIPAQIPSNPTMGITSPRF